MPLRHLCFPFLKTTVAPFAQGYFVKKNFVNFLTAPNNLLKQAKIQMVLVSIYFGFKFNLRLTERPFVIQYRMFLALSYSYSKIR